MTDQFLYFVILFPDRQLAFILKNSSSFGEKPITFLDPSVWDVAGKNSSLAALSQLLQGC